jgi:Cu(I)/Ag(I) efflux system membrane fusion protein
MPEGDEPPPRGVKTMAVVRWVFLASAIVLAAFSWWSLVAAQPRGPDFAHAKYHCPMHPQIVSDQPGECPICHMTLEPMPAVRSSGPNASASGSASVAASGARPLRPVPMRVGTGTAAPMATPGSTPPGTTSLTLALDRVQAIGVRTEVASQRPLSSKLRITAAVAPTEQGAAEVHVRAAGFVEQLYVDQTGIQVRAGQALFALYSPELYQAESELLAARQWGDAGAATTSAAHRKLELLGMASGDIDRVIAKGEPQRAIPVYAPQAGYVAKKAVVRGSYVRPEDTLYQIQDLSKVYVVADVFANDIARVHVGDEGTFTPTARPGVQLTAKVDLVYPTWNVEARTARVRLQLKNPDRSLRPGEYGTVAFALPVRTVLFVPRDAVVDTGEATYVFVDEGEGRFSPRVVTLDGEDGDSAIVRDGIEAGDRVVSGATFLIDSESRLRASIAASAPMTSTPIPGGSSEDAPSCDADFDRARYPDKWTDCHKCTQVHHGMGTMEADCKNAIPKPWK